MSKFTMGVRMPKKDEEHRLQTQCVYWFKQVAYRGLSWLLFAVPNGGARDSVTGAKLKAEGVTAGAADLLLLVARGRWHGLCIEMKTPQGRQSPAQKQWQAEVEAQGYRYEVVRTFEEFADLIKEYLSYGAV